MCVFVLPALFIYLIGCVFSQPQVCNPIECFNILDTLFQSSYLEDPCQKFTKLESYMELCSPNKVDNDLIKGLKEVKLKLCESTDDFEPANKCDNKHKYLLFSCVYEKLTLEAEDPNVNQKLLMCRKAYEGERCDVQSLSQCSDRAEYLSGVLFYNLFRPMFQENCEFTIKEIFELKLKPSIYMKDYRNLAECLDRNSPHVTECLPNKWIGMNTLFDVHYENKLCRAVQTFFTCVQGVVENKCNNLRDVFAGIQQPLYTYLVPNCSKQDESVLPLKMSDKSYNDVYDDSTMSSSTVPTRNETEVAVVHQHVVIAVTYHEKNCAAYHISSFYILIALILLDFCQHRRSVTW